MAVVDPKVLACVETMRRAAAGRDERMGQVRRVRDGEMHTVWPESFSERYPQSIVSNFIDVVARDLAEVVAPLPTLACSSGAMKTDADKRRAERKNRIGEHYWRQSSLDAQMFYGGDQYLTYGFLPGWVEADYVNKRPQIHLVDPVGCYYRMDRRMQVVEFARCWKESREGLIAQWGDDPVIAAALSTSSTGYGPAEEGELECVMFADRTNITLYVPARNGLVLASYAHGRGRNPFRVALRPGLHLEPRGQFDDVLWVQLARAVMAELVLEAGHKAVQAPIVVPTDVVELPMGADAVIQTDNGQAVRRVELNVPAAAFALEEQLDKELKVGARYPDARLGVAEASVITGKGVQALMGGFDTQIKTAQTILGRLLRDLTSDAFEVEEQNWPNKTEKVTGTMSGTSYELSYRPSVDIAGNYTCEVTYGFASGMSPANALVSMLQARGDGLVDRDFVRRQMPWGLDADQVQRNLDVELTEDALKAGLFAALQSAGQMMAQGMTDQAMMFFQAADDLIKGRQNGKPVNEVLAASFQAYQQKLQEQAQAAQAAQQAGAPGGGGIAGVGADGLPPGVAPGQAGMAPGGLPDVQSLVAGFRGNGQADLSSSVRRRLPTGA